MEILILSYFNFMYGPKVFLVAPESFDNEEDLKQITSLMDLYETGFFVHMFGKFKSANHIFEIPSQYARGSREVFLISVLVDIKQNINFDLLRDLLEGFEKEFKKIPEAYKALYIDSNKYEGDASKLEDIKNLFNTFYETFPRESVIYDRKDAKILIFGLFKAGKTTIINCLKKTITKNTLPTTHIDISRILVNNLSLYIYDTPGQLKYRNLWEPYLKNQDGLVFILDIADKEKFDFAKDILHEIALIPEMKNLPLLILYNKTDLLIPDLKVLNNAMGISELGNRDLKCFYTCGLINKNIDEAFTWLSKKILEHIYPSPKGELGIIFSSWDEKFGPKIISIYPNKIFDDPEVISIRCFSISQFLFGGEKFKRISVILPFTHLKIKAAIYFDFLFDEKVRGGRLPLSLVIFYNEEIPRAIIDQFNIYIFEKFAHIKEHYKDQTRVLKEIKKIHSTILKRLKSVEPTVQALRMAEMRYQILFKAARDAIIIIDRKTGIIVDANEQAETIIQRPLEDIIGLHSSQLEIKEYNQNFMDQILMQIELENSPPIELGIMNLDEKIIPVEINASEIKIGGDNLIQCIFRDVTERRIAERKLRESESKYRHLFKNSPSSIFLIDAKDIVVDCNPKVEQLLGYSREDLIGKEYSKLSIINPKYILLLRETLKNVMKGDTLTFLDIKMKKKDETTIWANIQSSLINIEKEIYFQIIANDITEQKEAELARNIALEALRESEIKFHYAYDQANFYKELFAFDINDVFNKIQSSLENLSDFEKNPENLKNSLNDIRKQVYDGTELVDKIQKFSSIEESRRLIVSIEVNKILNKNLESIIKNFPDKQLDINVKSLDNDLHVKANKYLFDVFENILINAVKYNKQPTVEVEINISKEQRENINYINIEFIDNGIGISDKEKANIFQKDKRDSRFRGILLGLILVDKIIDSYSGIVWVDDKVIGDHTQGSNFTILIPEA